MRCDLVGCDKAYGEVRQLALDWLAQPERDALVLVTGLFMSRPGLCFFFFHPVGAAFPPCRGFVAFFLPLWLEAARASPVNSFSGIKYNTHTRHSTLKYTA